MTTELVLNGILQGLALAIVAFAVMVPFRFLNFADLTSEGAYPLGGAVCAVALTLDIHPVFAILAGSVCSGIIGASTALVHLKFKVNAMLAGIILSTMAYSINLRIMGKPNIALFGQSGVFCDDITLNMEILAAVLCVIVLPFAAFLKTDYGLRFRAVGLNPEFAARQGISIKKNTILGLCLAGCLSGLAGGLIVQMQNYMDVGIGVGILIHGLASLMIGEAVVGNRTLSKQLMAPIVGALVYQQIQGIALSFGLAPSDLKFFTGAIVLLVMALRRGKAI